MAKRKKRRGVTLQGRLGIKTRNRRYRQTPWGRAELAKRRRKYIQKIRLQCLIAYGGQPPVCACCGESCVDFLSLDHKLNDGYQDRRRSCDGAQLYAELRRLGYPKDRGLQVLCFNCNLGRERNGGICPHHGKVTSPGQHLRPRRTATQAQEAQERTELQLDLFS